MDATVTQLVIVEPTILSINYVDFKISNFDTIRHFPVLLWQQFSLKYQCQHRLFRMLSP